MRYLFFLASIIFISVIVSDLIFDNSYDGQTYHYETQTAIINGWNPLKNELSYGTENIFFINHYAKGYETGAAIFQAFFKNPESGKALNFLLIVASFFYVSYLLQELKLFQNKFRLFFVALVISLNPVAVYQLFTFYVDGQIASLIIMLIASLYLLMKTRSFFHLLLASVIFCIISDVKFTGLIYAIIIFGFFGLWMIFKKINATRFIAAGLAAFIISFALIGFNPYVTNTIHQSNPFYPLAGKNKIDIMTPVQPVSFAHKMLLQKFAEANFSESHNIHGHTVTPEPKFKIPFTFSVNEWLVFKGSECRIAGYGPMFGGVLLISFILLVMMLALKRTAVIREDAFIIAVLIVLTLIINPEMWMSRYVPQLWLFPFCVMWLLKKLYSTLFSRIWWFLFLMITLNVAGIAAVNWSAAGLISYKMHKEIWWMHTIDKPVRLVTNNFIAARERMKYYGIEMNEVSNDSALHLLRGNEYKLQNSQAIILLKPGLPKFENKGILKLLDKKLE